MKQRNSNSPNENFPWKNFPWQTGHRPFYKADGSVQTGAIDSAMAELSQLKRLHDTLISQKDAYKANQVQIQINMGEAWINFKEGKNKEALSLMNLAAEMEDKTEKHPVTPGSVIPARELLGDMLMQMNQPAQALIAYEANLRKNPNRFNGLYGAGLAAEQSGDLTKANSYYKQLFSFADQTNSNRPELGKATRFLNQ